MEIKCEYTELVDVDQLVPNPRNPNTHPESQTEILAKNIKYQGFRHPIIVSKLSGFIAAGHGRLLAAKTLGMAKVPVDYQDFANEADEFRFMVADNKIASMASHDDSLMLEGMKDLELLDTDLELLGLDDFLIPLEPDAEKNEIEDDVPENVETKCKPGDIWILGDHRLMCGDSTDEQTVAALMNGEKADITFTSPPYNVGKTPNGSENKYNNYKDSQTLEDFKALLNDFTNNALIASDYVFSNIQSVAGNKVALIEHMYDMREKFADTIIWNKESAEPAIARKVLNSQFEYIHIFSNEAKRSIGKRDFRGTLPNIFSLNSRSGKEYAKIHKATFRVELPEYFLNNFTESSCFDPFGGTGTTLIACEKTKRKCFMIELDEKYCDVIIARWEKYSGKVAKLSNNKMV